MSRAGACFAFALLIAIAVPVWAATDQGQTLPEHSVADAAAPVVTEGNLLASERFWPYRVALTSAWQPAGRSGPLVVGSIGVLIRVEPTGLLRVDFGRDGLFEVPAAETDVLARANAIRTGGAEKDAPNFLYSVIPRLADSASASPRAYPFHETVGERSVLTVFADPDSPEFPAIVDALMSLQERDGLLTLFFPQGRHADVQVREQLRSLGWTVPFALDHLAEPYTETLLAPPLAPPALMLQTPEGRVLFASAWKPDVVLDLAPAVEAALGPAPTRNAAKD